MKKEVLWNCLMLNYYEILKYRQDLYCESVYFIKGNLIFHFSNSPLLSLYCHLQLFIDKVIYKWSNAFC